MTERVIPPTALESLLREIGSADPHPWYPANYLKNRDLSRDAIDPVLAELRVRGLAELTEWQPNVGQGYRLTMEGRRSLANPRLLDRPTAATPQESSAPTADRDFEPVVTRILISIQVGAFLVGMAQVIERGVPLHQYLARAVSPLGQQLAVSGIAVAAGYWWTLLTYTLVHGNLVHLGFNLFSLHNVGVGSEWTFGRLRYLAVYVISAWCGGIAAIIANPRIPTVGSSGAICGLFASGIVWVVHNRSRLNPRDWSRFKQQITSSLLLLAIISAMPGVSWSGHLGGLLGGAVTTWLLVQSVTRSRVRRWAALAGAALIMPTTYAVWYILLTRFPHLLFR